MRSARMLAVALGGLVILAASWPETARAYCQMTTNSSTQVMGLACVCNETGAPLKWKRPCISISLDARNTDYTSLSLDSLSTVVQRSFTQWTGVTCGGTPVGLQIQETANSICQANQYNPHGGNVNTVTFVPDWSTQQPPLPANAFALTIVTFDTVTGEILDADMLLNPNLGPYEDCPDTGCATTGGVTPVDLGNVVTHEAGHFFGLAHSNTTSATMYCQADRGEILKRTLDPDDIAGLCHIYGPPNTPTGRCNFTPVGGLDLNCEDGVGVSNSGGCAIGPFPTGDELPPLAGGALLVLGLLVERRRRRRH